MAIRIDAYVLLNRPWKPNFEAVASEIEWRYPQIGKARFKRRAAGEAQTTMVIDGAPVEISHVAAPFPSEQLHPPMRTIGHDNEAIAQLTAGQVAYIVVTATSPERDLEWTRAYAALVTLVASAVASVAEAAAVFWPDSWVCLPPERFEEQAGVVLRGQAPVALWCAFARSNPARVGGAEMKGIASLGLRTYVGRELELAPMPALSNDALDDMRAAARRLLEGEWDPEDNGALALESFGAPLVVRLADDGFLRMGVPAIVLVAPEAAVDSATLMRKREVAKAANGGIIGRLFGRV